MRHRSFAWLALLAASTASAQQHRPRSVAFAADDDSTVAENRNLRPAGALQGGVLTARLELRMGSWHPAADDGPAIPVYAFAEEGGPASVPGPLLRVPIGTELRLTLRNRLRIAIAVHGLHTRPEAGDDSLLLAPGEQREVRFAAGEPGTYYYWAGVPGTALEDRLDLDSQLNGALIVDPPGRVPADRVFVLGVWTKLADEAAHQPERDAFTINGKQWPHGETLTLAVGDSLRWRVINPTGDSHPMHLHGFYFQVRSRGGWAADTIYSPAEERSAVTELMLPGGTASLAWSPTRPGNWLFHCHFAFHVMDHLGMADTAAHPSHRMSMAGLVLGLHVTPPQHPVLQRAMAVAPRSIRLFLDQKPNQFANHPGMGFMPQDGAEPAPDSVVFPSPTLVLEQNRPVAITVINRLPQPTGVHWHGLEIESLPDGVPNWSGWADRVMAPIAPGDSFVARFTPPREGTFIYHAHLNEEVQLNSGLYGALVVLPPGQHLDAEHDRIVLVGGGLPRDTLADTFGMVNGSQAPAPMRLHAGTAYRFRLINIQPDWRVRFTLMGNEQVQRWSPIAKDGADLPPGQRGERPAVLVTGPGETADFEWTPPAAGEYRLDITTVVSGWHVPLRLIVSPAS